MVNDRRVLGTAVAGFDLGATCSCFHISIDRRATQAPAAQGEPILRAALVQLFRKNQSRLEVTSWRHVDRRRFLAAGMGACGVGLLENFPHCAGAATMDQAAFSQHQAQRREELWSLLGDLPPRDRPISARLVSRESGEGFTLEHLVLDLNGLEPVPALLLRARQAPRQIAGPDLHSCARRHLRTGQGRVAPRSQGAARLCAGLRRKGIVTLAIDSWCFSGRKHKSDGREGEHDAFKEMLWRGRVLWGMMMYDEVRALDYLAGRPEVDPARIGAFGLSMGSTKAWWLAALDPARANCASTCAA